MIRLTSFQTLARTPFTVVLMVISYNFLIACSDSDTNLTLSIEGENYNILVFSKTSGWRHDSIEAGKIALTKLATENKFGITITEDASHFTVENLEGYDSVIFLNTTETVFNDDQRGAFKQYIQSGGGFVGIHSATDTEYGWPWYNKLAGAYFASHPNNPNVRSAVIEVTDKNHPATKMLPDRWERQDEWYNFQDFNEDVHVLMYLDTNSYEGSAHPGNHPIAWYHEYDGGRAFYTALGHTSESFEEELFLEHLWGGIQYAMGLEKPE
ncbi:MAG: ThuA domain-containing protein [Balneolaceae bacterium]